MAEEIFEFALTEVRTREDNPNQHRELNYIVQYSTRDTVTGEIMKSGEYSTVASDIELTPERVEEVFRGNYESAGS